MLKMLPCVFAVKNTYQIMVRVESESLMWVKVGDNCYYDDSNGILRSYKNIHRMIVPAEELDKNGKYTIYEREIKERKPYFTETEEVKEYSFDFVPANRENLRAYHIADAHNLVDAPVRAEKAFGDIDFLIMNGDIPNHSGDIENFDNIYKIAEEITEGKKPVVFSRGNHDMRGIYAECIEDYTPTDNGKSYFTFRLGNLWGMVLDCGEDKQDDNEEYGNTVCCHAFRQRQTQFIKDVIKNADSEYLQEGIKNRLIIVHNPFTEQRKSVSGIFNIEADIYTEWGKLIRENIKPDAMLCGHYHEQYVSYPGDEHDSLGHPSPVIVGSEIDFEKKYFCGCGLEFTDKSINVEFTSSDGEILQKTSIKK